MIPKIIHQTWKDENVPTKWKAAVDQCRAKHPDFEYKLWTDEMMDNFVQKQYPEFHAVYVSYKHHIQRCDAFRYLVLYKYGGVYIDMDIRCLKMLNKFLEYDVVLARSSNIETSFTNSFFMTVPNHPFFKYCIDHLAENKNKFQYFGKHMHVMSSTGPGFVSEMLRKYGDIPNSYVLTKEEFAGDCTACNEITCKGGEFFTHIQGHSWHEIDSTILNILLCNKKKILFGLAVVVAALAYFFGFRKKRRFKLPKKFGQIFKQLTKMPLNFFHVAK